MKGLLEQTQTGTKFLVVKHHSICEESKEPRAGFKPVEVKNPRTGETITKFIKQYGGVEALVSRIEWYNREHDGTRFMGWKLHLDADGVPCILDLPFASRATGRFMKLAENLDFTRPVEFSAWYDKKNDATAFNVRQDGESVRQLYTRDDPGECPPPVQHPVTQKWNFDDQMAFLYDRMMKVVIPAVEEAGNEMPVGEAGQSLGGGNGHAPALPEQSEPEDDDIPF